MANKKKELDEIFNEISEKPKRPRARNKTVMLNSDVTKKVRSDVSAEKQEKGTAEIDQELVKEAQEAVKKLSSEAVANEEEVTLESAADPLGFNEPAKPAKPAKPAESIQLEEPVEASKPFHSVRRTLEEGLISLEPASPSSPTVTQHRSSFEDHTSHVSGPVSGGVNEDQIYWKSETKLIGFLVSYDKNENGDVYFLRVGRLLISSEKVGGGNLFYIKDASVSSMHAVLMIRADGSVHLLDQLSEHGTTVVKSDDSEVELLGDKVVLENGDVIKFGERNFKVCLIGE